MLGLLFLVPCAARAAARAADAGQGAVVAAQDAQLPWTLGTYPNPKVNLERCGRHGKASHICDPERLVDPRVLDELDAKLAKAPVKVEVAVMGDVGSAAFKSTWDLDEGFHAFAAHLAHDWGASPGIFVLYSVNDAYVDVQAAPQLRLDSGVTRHIARQALRRQADPGTVLDQVVMETLAALQSQHAATKKLTLDRSRLLFFILTCSLGIVALLLTACCAYDMAAHWRHQARFRSCRSKIQKIHEAFAKGYSAADSLCPICVENLPPLDTSKACPHAVVFLCGHRFHTDCANSWLVFNDAPGSCPVCELPHTYSFKEPQADEEMGQPSDEIKAFFLTSLRARFPESISEEQMKRWRNCHTEIWLNELQPRRYHSIWHSWGSTGSLTVPLAR